MTEKTPYWKKLQDPRWQKMRLEVMQRDGFKCRECSRSDQTLSVHHAYYISGRDPWNYPTGTLRTLCNQCHELEHEETTGLIYSSWEMLVEQEMNTGIGSNYAVFLASSFNAIHRATGESVSDIMRAIHGASITGDFDQKLISKFRNNWEKYLNKVLEEITSKCDADKLNTKVL